jgi:hypothetical protein
MNARLALKRYNDTMVKLYGVNYTERWTEDDRETFEILARNAAAEIKAADGIVEPNWKRSAHLRRVLGIRTDVKVDAAARKAAWHDHVTQYGNGVSGLFRRTRDQYDNIVHIAGEDRTQQSRKVQSYVTGVTAAELLASVNNG